MSAYVIVDIKVTDPDLYAQYRELAPAIVSAFGGEYLARGGKMDVLEGNCSPNRTVILKFPSLERAREWVDSPEYREARKMRHKSAISRMYTVDGVD
tara:strand:+ start:95491 stop:95781 length:291 start_codon:yes stop_codon:yes gene_type:complete